MVNVDLTEDQIESLISIMESDLFWNTDTPTLDSDYNSDLYETLKKALPPSKQETIKKPSRFEDIIR